MFSRLWNILWELALKPPLLVPVIAKFEFEPPNVNVTPFPNCNKYKMFKIIINIF